MNQRFRWALKKNICSWTWPRAISLASLPPSSGLRVWGVVVGTIGTITLVVARQLLALRELAEHEKRLVEQASHDVGPTVAQRRADIGRR